MIKVKFRHRLFKYILFLAVIAITVSPVMAQAPTATTQAATGIGQSTATLNGTINANGESTVVHFEYGLDTGYGGTWPATPSPVTGSTDTAVSAGISELLSNTTYHYRVVATNTNGTTYGTDMTFDTLDVPPSVTTQAATGIGADSATLNGTVDAHGYSTTVEFEYGTDTSYGTTVTADQSPVSYNFNFSVTASLSGLTNNTLYHFRIKASNVNGTSYGDDMTFVIGTVGSAPTATTNAATGISSGGATLNGTVNAGSLETTVTFEYGLTTAYGSTATATQSPVSGSTDTAVSVAILELSANETYHYRVVATNSNGTTNGADMTFTTLPLAPTAVTNSATSVGTTSATLNGTVNASGASTTVSFQYGLTTAYGTTVTATQSPVTGSTDTAVSRGITGLTNGVTYHYRVMAVNAGGTTYGDDMTVTPGTTAPTATTNAATSVGTTTATVHGTVNANGNDTTVTFEYGTSTNYDRSINATPISVTGTSNTSVSAGLAGLNPNTTYHYRVVAVNDGGTTYGADMTFLTLAAPIVTTNAATSVTTTGATLNGTVNANGTSSTATFEYGTTTAYGSTVSVDQNPVTGSTDTAVSKAITGLTTDTVYHYRVVGTNANGTTYGADMTFITTVGSAPSATTNDASSILFNGATLNGTVTANNVSTTVTFEYGTTAAYGSSVTADQSPVTGIDVPVSAIITGLSFNQTYHFRVVATNANGTTNGADMTFTTTLNPYVTAYAATNISGTSATLNGMANANNGSWYVDFQYSTDLSYSNSVAGTPSTVSGSTATTFSADISGLTPNTLYNYRARVYSGGVNYYSDNMTFTTSQGPSITTDAATGVGSFSVVLNGTANANNTSTTVTFEMGETTSYGRTISAEQNPVTGNTNTAVSASVNGLTPGILYHYRGVATNTNGTVYGADVTFTTSGAAPNADTNTATAVTTSGATLNGIVNANNASTTVTFEYGTTTSYGTTVTADQSPVTGVDNTAVSNAITGLTNNTTYHFRVVAQNSSGTTYGADMTFFTGTAAPTATTGDATGLGPTVATLNGTVNANNTSTTVTFEYGETISYGRTVTAAQSPVTGSSDTAVSVSLTGLKASTTYHYRVAAQNASGTTYGADMTFVTNDAGMPTVTTTAVSNITGSSAVSGGTVVDEGGATVTARGICWSTAPNPSLTDNVISNGTGSGAFTSNITGLAETTTYYVRAYATNVYGTAYGDELNFTTNLIATPTVNTIAITNITATSASSGGNVVDNGGAAITARGVCWSTAHNPTIANNKTLDSTGTGTYFSYLSNLNPDTTYYVRAYATNVRGTGYGAELNFTTNSATVNVEITNPSQGDMVYGTVTIEADASIVSADSSTESQTTAVSITKVEFYIDDEKIGQDTSQPYEFQWDSTMVSNGTHSIKAMAYDQDDNMAQDEISVTVSNGSGEILLNRTNLNYGSIYQAGRTADTTAETVVTSPQTVLIDSDGGISDWTVTTDAQWVSVSPTSGNGPGVITVSVSPTGMSAGSYTASLTVNNSNTGGSAVLPIYLTVYKQSATSVPFGTFATPTNNSVVMSSIPVTGWVLDDIEVKSVEIYRDPVSGEGGNMIYIGDAVLVDGARPDVEATYPYYPFNYQAGWGYMLLTYGLPNQGNGTFTLIARATDAEGHTVTLGTKTITCDNDNAEKPFGAIDSPGQGGIASGSNYTNFAWVLTPLPNTIPTDGSTLIVWVDGVPLGHPYYNEYRSDIATLFPGYNNSNGAGGHFFLNTANYANGVHTISWSATDNGGNTDGIGSRYFSIVNADSASAGKVESPEIKEGLTPERLALENNVPNRNRKGQTTPAVTLQVLSGIDSLTIKELGYVAVRIDDNSPVVRGYLEVNGRLDPLPIGSTLDSGNGIFYWHPGPGFIGRYPLVFDIETENGDSYRKSLIITIESK